MAIAVLYPRHEHAAIAERYASWQSQSRLRGADQVSEIIYYDPDEPASDVVAGVFASHVLVVIDPLVIVQDDAGRGLRAALEAAGDAFAAVPAQDEANPRLYLCSLEGLREEPRPPREVLKGRSVVVAEISIRTPHDQPPPDLLSFIPIAARSMLHVGCGDGSLGASVKQRQRCRVVGIETSTEKAAVAKRRIDDVYAGDLAHVVSILNEKFECIVTSGLLEQMTDPWSLLAGLRRITTSGGVLVISMPNVGSASVIGDLLAGRFASAAQLRFFTRESVEEMLEFAGWIVEQFTPKSDPLTPDGEVLLKKLRAANLPVHDDLLAARFTAVARNESE